MNRQGERTDVDKEFALLFTVLDENESWYLKENIQKRANSPRTVQEEDETFKESNRMHSINGYIYGNGPNYGNYLRMKMNDRVAWYVIGFGNEVDIHTLHFHGNDFIHVSTRYLFRIISRNILLIFGTSFGTLFIFPG